MMRLLPVFLLGLSSIAAQAQFGPISFAFESDVAYPGRVLSGDMDGDGDIDPLVYNSASNINNYYLCWFENQGGGAFGPRQVVFTGYALSTATNLLVRDMDVDGDGDLIADGNWYSNDGTGLVTLVGPYSPVGNAAHLLEDLDGDGDTDDIVRQANSINLLINNGGGSFAVGAAIGPSGITTSLAVSRADLDGDALPDLMIGGTNAQMGWYKNLGGGNYGTQQAVNPLAQPSTPFCGDVDADGDADLIAFGLPGGTVWFANDGLGTFSLGDTIPSGVPEALADFDGDGDVDFSAPSGTSCDVKMLRNNNGLSWTTVNAETVSGYNLVNTSYATGDLNGDGAADLLACSGMDLAGWFPNLGNGSIAPRARFCSTMAGAFDLSAGDIDLDGDKDLVTASYYGDWVCWYPNNGDGTFQAQRVVTENANQVSTSRLADLDADGLLDIITNKSDRAIIWNNNNGSSWTPDTLPGLGASRCEVDLDGDLDLDLVGNGRWYENDGVGGFTAHVAAALGTSGSAKAGDMNGDGIIDVVLGGTVVLNDGAGNFTTVPGGAAMGAYDPGDLDGDGDLDILQYNYGALIGNYNDGSGNMTSLPLATVPAGQPRTVLVRDINGDNFPDAVWALSNGYTHQTYYNLNLGNGQLGGSSLIDPTAESAAAMVYEDISNDAVPDLITARFRTISWQENYFFNAFRLRGSVFLDFDLDATLDTTDHKVSYRLVRTDANDILVWTNSDGDFDLPADTGTWDVWHTPPSIYQVTNDPDTLTASLTTLAPIAEGLDIGLAPALDDTLPFITTTMSGILRCNDPVILWLHLRNNGTFIPEGIVIDYYVHPDVTVVNTYPTPDSIVGDHIYWHVDSLGWFQEFEAMIEVIIGPVGSTAGFGYTVTAANLPLLFSVPPSSTTVSCAFDPNDKLVTPQGYGDAGAVPVDQEWLEYTVRFQNTGTDTAFTVQLLDTLDTDLDPLTMEVLAASHDLTRIQVDTNNVALFRFERILLPDSNTNQFGSNGFVKYRIQPNAGSPHLTGITNSAAIYFDLNPPVITNTVLNTLIDCALHEAIATPIDVDILQASAGDAYQWYLNGSPLLGETAQELTMGVSGDYTVQVTSIYGCVDVSDPYTYISTAIAEVGHLTMRVVPNPMSDQATVYFNEALTAQQRIELVDVSGRVVRSLKPVGRTVTIERGGLAAGSYVLRARCGDGDHLSAGCDCLSLIACGAPVPAAAGR
ncbi:MAG: T9SS type A sorting domain-containing protein [Flavobacteriales bacterium]|nr:T9SS type A sorting domain-containing protein [Flavobacteriales bacterium]